MVIQHFHYVILLTALIFYPRTSQIQLLFALFDLCRTNRIDYICKESIKAGNIPNSVVAQNVVNAKLGSHGGKDYTKVMSFSKGMEQRR